MSSKNLCISVSAALFAVVFATPALAQETMDARTEFTFTAPVELPGTTLPPGTYVFRFVDSTSSRKVMQVQAKDASSKNYGMFLTITAHRARPSDDAELRFYEAPAGTPNAVRTWWYPGNTIGREFIYPKDQARRIAQATSQPVLTTRAESVASEQMQSADLVAVSPSGREMPIDENAQASAASAATAADRTPVQEGQSASMSTRTQLPRTSTPLPLVAVFGLMSLAVGAALRFRL